MPGPPPKPTHLKIVVGNPGRRTLNAQEPQPARGKLTMPRHMDGAAQDAWRRMARILDQMGVLTEADAVALENLCQAYADLWGARTALAARDGLTYETANSAGGIMHRAYPEVAMIADADRRVRAWLAAFGMTPADRSRVKVADGKPEKQDPAAKYLA